MSKDQSSIGDAEKDGHEDVPGGLRFRHVANLTSAEGAIESKSAAIVAATTISMTDPRSRAAFVIVCRPPSPRRASQTRVLTASARFS